MTNKAICIFTVATPTCMLLHIVLQGVLFIISIFGLETTFEIQQTSDYYHFFKEEEESLNDLPIDAECF